MCYSIHKSIKGVTSICDGLRISSQTILTWSAAAGFKSNTFSHHLSDLPPGAPTKQVAKKGSSCSSKIFQQKFSDFKRKSKLHIQIYIRKKKALSFLPNLRYIYSKVKDANMDFG